MEKKAAIMNLTNEVIVNKNFLHKETKESKTNGVSEKTGKFLSLSNSDTVHCTCHVDSE